MAICFHHAALVFALFFTWLLASRARPAPDPAPSRLQPQDLSGGPRFLIAEELPELFERSYRALDKGIRPRSTRVGDDLFVARGYGKRSGKAQQKPLMGARGYGKRSQENVDRLLCLITKCNGRLHVELDEVEVQPPQDDAAAPDED